MTRGGGRRRPLGEPTRGKTAVNRLRQVDAGIALAWPEALTAGAPLVVDVGFGARPWTSLELWARWRTLNPALRVVALDIDPARVLAAQGSRIGGTPPAVDFRRGGFDLPAALGVERARVVRCLNVLRQYTEAAVAPALAAMAAGLEPGGLLIEGTTTPSGALVAFDVYRRRGEGLAHEALVFGTNFRAAPAPEAFQAILPKRLIHRMRDPASARFFAAWSEAIRLARPVAPGDTLRARRTRWTRAGALLRSRLGWPVDPRVRIRRRGYLVLGASLADG